MSATQTRQCIDSDTQVMTPARPGDAVWCGNCGATVDTYARPDDTNQIVFIAPHQMGR